MEVIGNYIKNFLTRFWIWVVAITLFGVAITGERMTGFRILYMALFLFFIITFQVSNEQFFVFFCSHILNIFSYLSNYGEGLCLDFG